MAKWDEEKFNMQEPPNDIMCATCKFKLSPVIIAEYKQDRYKYNKCSKYDRKPEDILWNHGLCSKFEKEV